MLPLKSITVGPSGSQQSVFDSIVHRIKYGETKVYDYSNDIMILPYENMEHFNKETMTMYLILRSEETMNV